MPSCPPGPRGRRDRACSGTRRRVAHGPDARCSPRRHPGQPASGPGGIRPRRHPGQAASGPGGTRAQAASGDHGIGHPGGIGRPRNCGPGGYRAPRAAAGLVTGCKRAFWAIKSRRRTQNCTRLQFPRPVWSPWTWSRSTKAQKCRPKWSGTTLRRPQRSLSNQRPPPNPFTFRPASTFRPAFTFRPASASQPTFTFQPASRMTGAVQGSGRSCTTGCQSRLARQRLVMGTLTLASMRRSAGKESPRTLVGSPSMPSTKGARKPSKLKAPAISSGSPVAM